VRRHRTILLLALVAALGGACTSATLSTRATNSGALAASAASPEAAAEHGGPIAGTVVNADGQPIADALVAVISSSAGAQFATTAADGSFLVKPVSEPFALSVSRGGYTAGYRASEVARSEALVVKLEPAAFEIRGMVEIVGATMPADARVQAQHWSNAGEVYYAAPRADGSFALGVRPGPYVVTIEHAQLIGERVRVETAAGPVRVRGFARGEVERPATDSVVAEIRAAAYRVRHAAESADEGDLAAAASLFAGARVIGLGEATHGTREFFTLKHRLFAYLVQHHGVRALAMEAAWGEARAIDDYVTSGRGDPALALAGLHFWTWDTEEVRALIEWMRAYNRKVPASQRVRFYGIDIQYSAATLSRLIEFLKRVDSLRADDAQARLHVFSTDDAAAFDALSNEQRLVLRADLDALRQRFDAQRSAWERRTSRSDWAEARHHVEVLRQVEEFQADRKHPLSYDVRDRFMAENALWVLGQTGAPVVVWAHNGHVTRREFFGITPLGEYLGRALGERYLAVGLFFSEGSFRARDGKPNAESAGVVDHSVGAAPAHFWDAAFARLGWPIALVSLSRLRASSSDWLRVPHGSRELGAVLVDTTASPTHRILPEYFDAALFVNKTTAARPTETGRRGPGK
jgi:erythromycin esterase